MSPSRKRLPRPLQRTATLDGETFTVVRSRATIPTDRVFRLGGIGAVLLGSTATVFAWVAPDLALAFALIGVFALVTWFTIGLVVLPVLHRNVGTGDEVIDFDAHGLAWNRQRITWAEIKSIAVAPYPYADRSYVYCLEIRLRDGALVRVAPAVPREALEYLRRTAERRRRAAPRRSTVDAADLQALDELVGRRRSVE